MAAPTKTSRGYIPLLLLVWSAMGSIHVTNAFVPTIQPGLMVPVETTKAMPRSALGPLWSTISEEEEIDRSLLKKQPNKLKGKKIRVIAKKAKEEDANCLELDPVGRLRLCHTPDILLQGLDPSVWSASRPKSGKTNSLFLHTSHPESQSEHQTSLGSLISCRRLLACARQNRYWMGPKAGEGPEDIPFDTQFLLIEIEEDQQYALMLPLVDNGFRASLSHNAGANQIEVVCAAESGDAAVTGTGMRALYVAVGEDPFKLVQEGFANVAEATGTFQTLDKKKVPSSINDFGWCTWDAFYSKVSPEGILEGVQALKDAGVPPRTIILDDGWQQVNPSPPDWLEPKEKKEEKDDNILSSIMNAIVETVANPFVKLVTSFYTNVVRTAPHGSIPNMIWSFLANNVLKGGLWDFFDSETDFNRQLDGFEANHKFEGSDKTLKGLVTELKEDHGIKSVYCWHALHGYWRGVSEDVGRRYNLDVTNSFPKPSQSLMKLEPHAAWDPVSLFGVGVMTNKDDLEKFYTHLHTPLVQAGVDGVKVDVQSGVSSAGDGVGGGPHISKLYMKAMEASVSKRFPSDNGAVNCINCMCHSTENLYRHKETSVARASEDFFPDRPESHTAHLVNVAYNSLFLGEICLPDWDMFHSKHESAELHAAARAIGGCPVYVSDKPGQHDPELLSKLVMPDGSLLRATQPGRPTRDCLFSDVTADQKTALKIWNMNQNGGVVGAFNVQGVAWNFDTHENEVLDPSPSSVTTLVKPYDIEYLRDAQGPFAVWRHRTGTMDFLEDGNSAVKTKLHHRDWEIFTICPIQVKGLIMWAPIGLPDMMNTGGSILSTGELEEGTDGTTRAKFETRGPGRFVSFANTKPKRVLLAGGSASESQQQRQQSLSFSYDKESGELSFDLPEELSEGEAHHITVEW
ncbi:Galactinol--sucrose galactosyltransferase [Seminavis robusta]|uniref:galactinol--sucrose galactosyltransferase n=1 Tax=Seminavis robusta TaxID=568900 RepID=A0A9N8EJY7_9STRA|nr:Galactinol--sucrose galactosyltransferase [Seminavis robusta]|eukprot:Sro1123_g243670.1 Galactinol--sucrose galactosyltransferase (914) ;mRNA; f:18633-21458